MSSSDIVVPSRWGVSRISTMGSSNCAGWRRRRVDELGHHGADALLGSIPANELRQRAGSRRQHHVDGAPERRIVSPRRRLPARRGSSGPKKACAATCWVSTSMSWVMSVSVRSASPSSQRPHLGVHRREVADHALLAEQRLQDRPLVGVRLLARNEQYLAKSRLEGAVAFGDVERVIGGLVEGLVVLGAGHHGGLLAHQVDAEHVAVLRRGRGGRGRRGRA